MAFSPAGVIAKGMGQYDDAGSGSLTSKYPKVFVPSNIVLTRILYWLAGSLELMQNVLNKLNGRVAYQESAIASLFL
jgi:hypothetical protein